jgi:hypothetical protein
MDSCHPYTLCFIPTEKETAMTIAAKNSAKNAVKSTNGKAARASSARTTRSAPMTPEELHRDMVAYGKKVSATKASALAFLKSIGAPV